MNNYELMLYKFTKYTPPTREIADLHKAIDRVRFSTTTLDDSEVQPLKSSFTGEEVAKILSDISAKVNDLEGEIWRRYRL